MTKRLLVNIIVLTFMSCISAIPWDLSGIKAPPSTVDKLVLSQYLGRWYQVYGNRFVYSTFEKGSCQTADYAIKGSNVTILNTQNLVKPGGKVDQINGTAIIADPKEPGKLTAYLNTGLPITFGAPYWVLKLGPAEGKDGKQYQYAVVSDPVRVSLFVLARNTTDFKIRFESEVLSFLSSNGFTNFLNKPVAGVQGSHCKYVPPGQNNNIKVNGLEFTQLWRLIFK